MNTSRYSFFSSLSIIHYNRPHFLIVQYCAAQVGEGYVVKNLVVKSITVHFNQYIQNFATRNSWSVYLTFLVYFCLFRFKSWFIYLRHLFNILLLYIFYRRCEISVSIVRTRKHWIEFLLFNYKKKCTYKDRNIGITAKYNDKRCCILVSNLQSYNSILSLIILLVSYLEL